MRWSRRPTSSSDRIGDEPRSGSFCPRCWPDHGATFVQAMSETKRRLANIDVFEQEPGARPADLIGGLGRSREPRIRSSVSLSELFDDRRLPRDLADDLR